MAFRVLVDDNFHHMDPEEHQPYEHGRFTTAQAALEAARGIVDEYLIAERRPGMTAAHLFDLYRAFGDDPFIVGEGGVRVAFSAWDYAKGRCQELCAPDGTDAP